MAADKKAQRDSRYTSGDIDNKWDPSKGTDEGACAGRIDGVNISLDTLREEEYYQISRRRELKRAWEGFQEALKYPEVTVKINCVPMGQDTESLLEIGALAKDYPVHVRFIEMMPIGLGKEWKGKTEKEIKELLENRFGRCRPFQGVLEMDLVTIFLLKAFRERSGSSVR